MHQLHIERAFGGLKHSDKVKSCKPNDRLDQLIHHFKLHEREQATKDATIKLTRNVKPSKAMKDHNKTHPKLNRAVRYTVEDVGNGEFRVLKNGVHSYTVMPNPWTICNKDTCKVM